VVAVGAAVVVCLTNNHVIDGATKITSTVVATGRSYAAAVGPAD
jgi:S1-C subfamily serine protease